AAGPDAGARPPDRRAAGPRRRLLYAAQRDRPARPRPSRARLAGLRPADALSAGPRRLARAAHAIRQGVCSIAAPPLAPLSSPPPCGGEGREGEAACSVLAVGAFRRATEI